MLAQQAKYSCKVRVSNRINTLPLTHEAINSFLFNKKADINVNAVSDSEQEIFFSRKSKNLIKFENKRSLHFD